MMSRTATWGAGLILAGTFYVCRTETTDEKGNEEAGMEVETTGQIEGKYTEVELKTDLSSLSDKERQMIPLLIDACREMEAVFWREAFGDREALMSSLQDPMLRQFAQINYGPWDRLDGNKPFLEGYGPKPEGANFYPQNMTRSEFTEQTAEGGGNALESLYTLVRRDDYGRLKAIPYHQAFEEHHRRAAEKLRAAAELAEDPGLRRYLELRAQALLTDQYQESDFAWMEMKENTIDVVIGPIETYEDQLFGFKAAHECFVLVKDRQWSQRLSRYAAYLPELQQGLPVPPRYKSETPGTDSDLNAYDAIYFGGDCNAGSKTIAINLPNDEQVQLEKGTRRLQLKNVMRAKFEKILVPISRELIVEGQRDHITFDAFFDNTMFHEVAHGLGIKKTLDGESTVRRALKKHASTLEEGKADILGLYMITRLHEKGELGEHRLEDNYVTFLASIFRSIRFGASSAHGRANLVRFNYFKEKEAFTRDAETGHYKVDFQRMREAMNSLSEKILRIQGDGDFEAAGSMIEELAQPGEGLQEDLDKLASRGIPIDLVFKQGVETLGM